MQEQNWVEVNEKIIDEREKGITEVCRGISELNSMYKELSGLVSDQQEYIDQLEKQTTEASTRTRTGLEDIHLAHENQKDCIIM
jgi:t-SNARE complex subunit (syntaxin)